MTEKTRTESDITGLERDEEADAERRVDESDESDVLEPSEQQDKRVVRWYGQAGVDYREISLADWRQAGLDIAREDNPPKAVRWDKSNDYAVPLSFFDFLEEAQVEQFLVADGRFKIEER